MNSLSNDTSFFRARLDVLRIAIVNADPKSQELILLRNGVMQDHDQEQILIAQKLKSQSYPNTPLSFLEQCSFNTWFAQHPEKICGEEIISTSIQFPLTIKGNRDTIQSVIQQTLSSITFPDLEMQALALEIELQLQELL